MMLKKQNKMMLKNQATSVKNKIFVFFCFFVAFVSSIDTSLTVHTQKSLKDLEINPIARFILERDGWESGNFVGIKMFATITVLGILILIYKKNVLWGLIISFVLAILQGLLLIFLLL